MYGREFADHRPVADFDVTYGSFLILQILRLHADERIRENLALLADRRVAVDNRALSDRSSVAELYVGADARVSLYNHVLAEHGSVFNNSGRMNFRHTNSFLFRDCV